MSRKHGGEYEPEVSPRESDVVELIKKMQKHLVFLEKKIDILIEESQKKSFVRNIFKDTANLLTVTDPGIFLTSTGLRNTGGTKGTKSTDSRKTRGTRDTKGTKSTGLRKARDMRGTNIERSSGASKHFL